MKRTPLKRRGKRSQREAAAVKAFRESVVARGMCQKCGWRATGDTGALHAHHIVLRSRGPGWEYLHDPEVNGAALCFICHDHVHAERVEDWRNWIKPLRWGEERAAKFEKPNVREDWQLVARLRWHPAKLSKPDLRVVGFGVAIAHVGLSAIPPHQREPLEELARRLGCA